MSIIDYLTIPIIASVPVVAFTIILHRNDWINDGHLDRKSPTTRLIKNHLYTLLCIWIVSVLVFVYSEVTKSVKEHKPNPEKTGRNYIEKYKSFKIQFSKEINDKQESIQDCQLCKCRKRNFFKIYFRDDKKTSSILNAEKAEAESERIHNVDKHCVESCFVMKRHNPIERKHQNIKGAMNTLPGKCYFKLFKIETHNDSFIVI